MIRPAFTGLLPVLVTLLGSTVALAQLPAGLPKAPTTMTADTAAQSPADTAAAKLDAALAASSKGDKAATVSALNAGVAAAEAQAATSKGDFKDKLMSQAGNLKKLIPGVSSGLVGGNVLSKAVSLVKMALGANQISSLLGGGGGLLGSVGALTGGLNLMKGALPAIGGGAAAATGSSLISNALSSVSKLSGVGGAAAEPAVKQQLGGVLNFAKGIL
ncbi:hypothetical protein ACAW74_06740 [Fibrella sp. WM1]|uniref:hypothetical protein n=1 Tax=Fibrella musci TaxID=3242485 RepID=UPI00352012BF